MTAPGQRLQGSLATLPFGASSLSLIGTSLEINENDILCSSCSRHRMLQKGPSQFITHSIYIAMALKHYLWDVNFLSAVNNLYRVEGEWKKDCEYIYFLQWRVFCLSSNYLFESSLSVVNDSVFPHLRPFRAVKSLQHSMHPKEITRHLTLPWRDPSRQAGRTQELFVNDSPTGVMFPLLSCSFCNVPVASAIFLVYKCNTLNGPNWTPGSLWEGYLWKDCRKLKTFFSTRKIQPLYKQTLRTGHKPRDYVWDPLKRMHVCGKPNGHLESSLLPKR